RVARFGATSSAGAVSATGVVSAAGVVSSLPVSPAASPALASAALGAAVRTDAMISSGAPPASCTATPGSGLASVTEGAAFMAGTVTGVEDVSSGIAGGGPAGLRAAPRRLPPRACSVVSPSGPEAPALGSFSSSMRAFSRQLPGASPRRAGALVSRCPPRPKAWRQVLSAGRAPPRRAPLTGDVLDRRSRLAAARVVAVQAERVGERTGAGVERPLRQPGHLWGNRRREVGHKAQPCEHIVGSNGRRHVPNNHAQYDTRLSGHLSCSSACSLQHREPQHRLARVEAARPLLGEALDFHVPGREELLHRRIGVLAVGTGQPHLPLGDLQ